MNTQNFHEADTVLVQTIAMPGMPLTRTPRTDKIRISPMRFRSIQASMRAEAFPATPPTPLKAAAHRLFMEVMRYFHEYLDAPMPDLVRDGLHRLHDASQGLFVDHKVILIDLVQIKKSAAGQDASVVEAIQAAEQALLNTVIH